MLFAVPDDSHTTAFRSRGPLAPTEAEGRRRPGPEWKDVDLILRVLEGDTEAFRWIVERYQARVYTHIFRIVHKPEDAEDLAQETFVRAYRSLGRYDPDRPFSTWLLTIGTRLTLNSLRRKEPAWVSLDQPLGVEDSSDDFTLHDALASDGEGPAEAAATEELRARLEEAAERLPASMRAVFNLRYQEDLPLAEIGKVTGMSLAAVKVALHRARKFLRDWIQP